jgi:hypothetical protein
MARQADWFGIGMESWLLGLEMAQVMWLRGCLIALGGAEGEREARRMVEEKLAANTAFGWALATGGAGYTAASVGRKALRHYGARVRANGRRLKRA